jgi:hypothetical protein
VEPLDSSPEDESESPSVSAGSVGSVVDSVDVVESAFVGSTVGSVAVGGVPDVVLAAVVLSVMGAPVGTVALPLAPLELTASVSAPSVPA